MRWSARRGALGGVVGPVAFIAAWVGCGWATSGYSPRTDAISELAAVDAPHRWAMTAGFVAFGLGVLVYALARRRRLGGRAWIAAATTAIATLAVAAVPLGAGRDGWHGACAGIGYAALAATPALGALELGRRGAGRRAWVSAAAAGACGVCLVASVVVHDTGLFQRLGLTIGDLWVMVSAAALTTSSS